MRAIEIGGAEAPGRGAAPARLHREITVSPELIAASRCGRDEALRIAGGSDAGLEEADAIGRLRRFGANRIAQERRTGVFDELVNRTKNPLNGLLLTLAVVSYFLGDARAAVVISTMVVLSIVTAFIQEHRSNEAAAKTAGAGEDHCERQAAWRRAARLKDGGLRRDPDGVDRPGRHRRALGGRHDPGRSAVDLGQGPVRQPVDAHRRGDADREIARACAIGAIARRRSASTCPTSASWAATCVSGYGIGVIVHTGRAHLLRHARRHIAGQRVPHRASTKGINRFTWLMIRFILVHGAAGLPHQRPDQGRLAGGAPVRARGRRRPHARDAADDRHRQSRQGRDRDVAQEGDRQAPATPSRTSAPWTCCAPTRPAR